MEAILHCNACHKMYDKRCSAKFFVTACKHTFCETCAQPIKSTTFCADCKEPTEILEINDKLPSLVKDWFMNPTVVANKQHRELEKILLFQQELLKAAAPIMHSKFEEAVKVIEQEAPMVKEEEERTLVELERLKKRLEIMHRADLSQLRRGRHVAAARMARPGGNSGRGVVTSRPGGSSGRGVVTSRPGGSSGRGVVTSRPNSIRCTSAIGRPKAVERRNASFL